MSLTEGQNASVPYSFCSCPKTHGQNRQRPSPEPCQKNGPEQVRLAHGLPLLHVLRVAELLQCAAGWRSRAFRRTYTLRFSSTTGKQFSGRVYCGDLPWLRFPVAGQIPCAARPAMGTTLIQFSYYCTPRRLCCQVSKPLGFVYLSANTRRNDTTTAFIGSTAHGHAPLFAI
jgi:hypothetical protein